MLVAKQNGEMRTAPVFGEIETATVMPVSSVAPKAKYRVLMKEWRFDIKKLVMNTGYQRMIEYARVHSIKASIMEDGYWGDEVITINKNYEVLNGQHRLLACMSVGVQYVPVVMLEFASHEDEVNYFVKKNSWNTKLSPADFWHARQLAGHPLGVLVYRLGQDANSYLCRKIALKKMEADQTNHVIFTAAQAILFLNTAINNNAEPWSLSGDQRLTELLCLNTTYENALYLSNRLVGFLYNALGTDRSKNRFAFSNKPLKSFCRFYVEMIRSGCAKKEDDLLRIAKHMATFPYTVEYARLDKAAQIDLLTSYCNRVLPEKSKIALKGADSKKK